MEEMKDEKYPEHMMKDHADTIMKAHEIMGDKEMMKHVKPHLDKKAKAIRSIAALRERAKEMKEPAAEEKSETPEKEKSED